MYNEVNFDFETLDLPNVVYAHKKGENPGIRLTTHPFLQPLIIKLAMARPKWRLIGNGCALRDGNTGWVNRFKVMDGNVELGIVRKDYNYGRSEDVFAIDNSRMSEKRQRGSATITKDISKAFRTVIREFYGKTTDEILAEARGAAYNTLVIAARSKLHKYQSISGSMQTVFAAFAEANWQQFATYVAEAHPTSKTNTENYHEAKAEYKEGEMLSESWANDEGYIVVLRGLEYIIRHKGDTQIYTSEQLTPHMKRAVGILKLAENGTFVSNFGIKAKDDVMYVLPEDKANV